MEFFVFMLVPFIGVAGAAGTGLSRFCLCAFSIKDSLRAMKHPLVRAADGRRTKIVCTLGPASDSPEMIER
jgi:hypothetical protein